MTPIVEAKLAATPGEQEPKPKRVQVATAGRYKVRKGDSVGGIARRFGVSQKALMAANGLRNPKQLKAGQVLKVPAKRRSAAEDVLAGKPARG